MNEKTLISFDFAIKNLLRNKGDYDIVEGFISALIGSCGYPPVKITALLDAESNKEIRELKKSIADVIVEDEQGNKYIVEIDRSYTSLFLHKACFNSSRLIVDSISSNEDYSTIKKIIHINLLYSPVGNIKSPLHHGKTVFHEIDTVHPQRVHLANMGMKFFDSHNVFPEYFVISVPLFNDVIKTELDEWLYMMKYSEVKETFKSPYMKKVAERLSLLKMSELERKIYRNYMSESFKERDYIVSAEEKAREDIEKGREEGIEIGQARGEEKKAIAMARKMLAKGKQIDEIIEFTDLSKEQIEKLRQYIAN